MPRHLLAILVALGVFLTGQAVAQEPARPAEEEEPPLRLIKKKPSNPDPKADPGDEPGERLRDPEKDPAGKPEEKEPGAEGPAPLPRESEAEVIARIITNMRRAEEKLQKRELDEGIVQTQADVLKDLDSLIALGERQQQQQQQANQPQQSNPGGGSQDQADSRPRQNPGGSKPQAGSRQAGGNKPMGGSRPSAESKPQSGSQPGGMRTTADQPGRSKPGPGKPQPDAMAQAKPQPKPAGTNPGEGGKGETGPRDLAADQYKDVWGHLPESMRAQMNAYSDPRPFMPRYDDLIKRFYQTIAEKGQK